MFGVISMLLIIVFCLSWPKAVKHGVEIDNFKVMSLLSLSFIMMVILSLGFFKYEFGMILLIIAWAMLLKTLYSVIPLYIEFRNKEDQ